MFLFGSETYFLSLSELASGFTRSEEKYSYASSAITLCVKTILASSQSVRDVAAAYQKSMAGEVVWVPEGIGLLGRLGVEFGWV